VAIPVHMPRVRSALTALLALLFLALPAAASAHLQLLDHSDPVTPFNRFQGHGLRAAAAGVASLPGLAKTWCGVENTVHGLLQPLAPDAEFRLVYAYPAGSPDRFSRYSAMMQGDASALASTMALASNNTKSLRWQLGSVCGPQYADIATVRLPHPASYYDVSDSNKRMSLFEADILGAMGPSVGRRDYVVYADDLPSANVGSADLVLDDRPGPDNNNNMGGRVAVLWGEGGSDFMGGLGDDERRAAVLHEVGHLLGGVQLSAPHSTGAGHCNDGWDIMCYDDGGPDAHMSYPCPGDSTHAAFDCNHDDYFNPAPASWSYLGTHWNAYNSVFLCSLTECAPPLAPPQASVRATNRPVVGKKVVLDASSSVGPGGIVDYKWDLNGDGTYETDTGTVPRVSRVFRSSRKVVVGLAVRDGAGNSGVDAYTVKPRPAAHAAKARKKKRHH